MLDNPSEGELSASNSHSLSNALMRMEGMMRTVQYNAQLPNKGCNMESVL